MGTIAAVGVGIASLALSAYGTVSAGEAQASQAKYQSQVAANNAIIANQNATSAINAGEAQAQAQGQKGAATAAAIRAAEAANGVDINSGSDLNVQKSQAIQSQLDTQTTMNNAQLQAYGYRTQATNFNAQSSLYNTEASQAITGSEIGAGAGLLGGASSLAFKWNAAQPQTTGDSGAASTTLSP